jgi:hypothetical protein
VSLAGGPGRTPEGAEFGTTALRAARRPPVFVVGWVLILAAFVAVGLSGRSDDSGANTTGGVQPTTAAVDTAGAGGVARVMPRRSFPEIPPRFDPTYPELGVTQTSAPGPISLQATRHPSTVFVHGDVFAQRVTWIFVSLQSLDGQVGGWASVSIPGAAGDGGDHRPALRFDVELAIPTTMAAGVLAIQANAYDAAGNLVASTGVRLASEK